MVRFGLVLAAFLLTISASVNSQNPQNDLVVKFQNLTVQDKLPSHRVLCVCQDQRGFMWFGTEEGLCRYDGHDFVEFFADINDPYSLKNHAVRSITEDLFGNLWIGTDGGGLHYFDQKTWRFHSYPLPYQPLDDEHSKPGHIYAILRTTNEQFWIGSYGQGLYQLPFYKSPENIIEKCTNGDASGIIHIIPDDTQTGLHDINVFCLYEDKEGTIWIGTDDYGTDEGGALHKLISSGSSPNDYSFRQYRSVKGDETTLGSNYIMSMYEDSKGRFWVCNWEGGLNLLDRKTDQVKCFRPGNKEGDINCDNIYSITEDHNGNLWVASYGGGISMISEFNGEMYFIPYLKEDGNPNSIIGDYVRQIFADKSGLLWAITWKSGISRIRISSNPFKHIPLPNHLLSDTISEVVQQLRLVDSLKAVLFTEKQGYMILDVGTNLSYKFSDLSSPDQWPRESIRTTRLARQFAGNLSFERLIENARVYLEDSNGDLWIGKSTSLYHIRSGPLNDFTVEEFFRNSQNPASLKGYHVTGIVEDNTGRIWVSTFDALNYYDSKDQSFKYFTMKDGLPGNAISGMLLDDKNLIWLATEGGLARFDPVSLNTLNYSEADGLPFTEFCSRISYGMEDYQVFPTYLKLQDGRFLFSSVQYGFVLFHPDSVFRNVGEPRTWITGFNIMNARVNPENVRTSAKEAGTEISFARSLFLDSKDKSFSFNISVLDYYAPDLTQFAYRLRPIDDSYRYMDPGIQQVTFSLLPHGEYVFEVLGANSDGIWSTEPAQVYVHIPEPWFSKTWFRLLLFVSITLIVTILLIRSKQRNQILNDLSIERLRSEEHDKYTQMRLSFYTNVTHEFRTQLTLILGPLGKLERLLPSADVKSDFSIMKRNGLRLLNLVNQLMDFRKIETNAVQIQVEEGDLTGYIRGICDLFSENVLSRGLHFKFSSNPISIHGYFDRSAIDKVVFNLLSNAFKYTQKNGTILVSMSLFERSIKKLGKPVRWVRIIVEDDGRGIPAHLQERIFERFYQVDGTSDGSGIGLSIVKSLLDLHYGDISLESEPGKGTIFKVEIPIDEEAYSQDEISDRTIHAGADFSSFRPRLEGGNGKSKLSVVKDESKLYEVLIVEDNQDMLSFIDGILKQEYKTRRANSAEIALHILENNEPDMILTDLLMPGIGGIEFVRSLKENAKYSHIPIIVITALEGKEYELSSLRLGAEDFLRKPFDAEILGLKVQNLLKKRGQFRDTFINGTGRESPNMTVSRKDQDFLNSLMQSIDSNYSNPAFGVKDLVDLMGMSHSVLLRKVRSLTGQSLNELIVIVRLEKSREYLIEDNLPIKEVAYLTGFSDPKYFSTRFKRKYGKSPSLINS